MVKPQKIARLERGKLIDAQRGFVATFNWLVQFILGFYASEDFKVEEDGDTVKVSINTETSARYV
jgi:hypothetical protein